MVSSEYHIRHLEPHESPKLQEFLSKPDIDTAFNLPLSQRTISVKDRVTSKFERGFWLGAFRENEIIGCRGCNGVSDGYVEFSTIVVANTDRRAGVGRALVAMGVVEALSIYGRHDMRLDTTPDNVAGAVTVEKLGFIAGSPYLDEQKRGNEGQSIMFTLAVSAILSPMFDPKGMRGAIICRQLSAINPNYACMLEFI